MRARFIIASMAALVLFGACSVAQDKTAPDTAALIAAALIMPDRPQSQVQRDATRNPAELLKFSGIGPGDQVADFGAGGGYFSRLLSALVGPNGKVIVQNPPSWIEQYKSISPALKTLGTDRANISVLTAKLDDPGLPVGALDAVTMMLIYHDAVLLPTDRAKMNAAIFAALKPGGRFLVT
ncbi:hypothetical protein MNBD_ALPHA06-512, partial [hydrothermal vent metagenome]